MSVRKTSVAVDEQLLEAVQDELGTRTVRETIDMALREVLRNRARRAEVAALTTMEGMDLADEEAMAGAWRP